MLDQVLDLFAIKPDHDLDLMSPNQALDQLTAKLLTGIGQVLDREKPDLVLVHGDTSTTLAGSLAAFYRRLPDGARGGRSAIGLAVRAVAGRDEPPGRNPRDAFSLRAYRAVAAKSLDESVDPSHIHLTGNTVIDALMETVERLRSAPSAGTELRGRFSYLDLDLPLILVTGHRRENFGDGFENICNALLDIVTQHNVQIVYPVHPNPNVLAPVQRLLGAQKRFI